MMKQKQLTVGVVQMSSGPNRAENLKKCVSFVKQAAKEGVQLLVFPEVTTGRVLKDQLVNIEEAKEGETFKLLSPLAKAFSMTLMIGFIERNQERRYNSLLVIGAEGEIKTVYRKLNLFVYPKLGIDESKRFDKGEQPMIVELEGLKVGLSICYDLRFPVLFFDYAKAGAQLMVVPSAFTYETGKKDWEALLKRRAMDTKTTILAPNQYGSDPSGVRCYGHSMIVGPTGTILSQEKKEKDALLVHNLSCL